MSHQAERAETDSFTEFKLALIKSPVMINDRPLRHESINPADAENLGHRDGPRNDYPKFEKHHNSTNLELFYDLWFVANLEVFTSVHEVSDRASMASYGGYLSMLYVTWLLVGMFDARYITDSVFERLARVVHLGVMVGFAIIATNYDPEDQKRATFQTMSLILMISRLLLAVQYSMIIWHVRHYRKAKEPLGIMVGINLIAALIYMGISFRFTDSTNSHVYTAWYIIGVLEVLLNMGLSLCFKVLSFEGTHLTERMTLLTLIILGEGWCCALTKSIHITNDVSRRDSCCE